MRHCKDCPLYDQCQEGTRNQPCPPMCLGKPYRESDGSWCGMESCEWDVQCVNGAVVILGECPFVNDIGNCFKFIQELCIGGKRDDKLKIDGLDMGDEPSVLCCFGEPTDTCYDDDCACGLEKECFAHAGAGDSVAISEES